MSGPLGRAVSLGLAAHGVIVVDGSIESGALEGLAGQITDSTGKQILPAFCDVTDVASVEQLVARAVDAFGGVDILCTAAGTPIANAWWRWRWMTGPQSWT